MTHTVDLDAYFARVGYAGPRTPSFETLRALHELHPAAIPFEALDVLLGRGIDLSPVALDAKLIRAHRGGYCYEHNGLFQRVLTQLGFAVEGLAARVLWMMPADAPRRPLTHKVLRVMIDGVFWLVDVGFGGCVSTVPLRFDSTEPQPTPHEPFRLRAVPGGVLVEVRLGEAWSQVYEIAPVIQAEADYELMNWFASTHPRSHFRQNLVLARTTPHTRFALLNNRLTIRTPDGGMDRRTLTTDELGETLSNVFGLPVEPSWRPLLEKATAAA